MKNFYTWLLNKLGWEIYNISDISQKSVVAVLPHTSYLDGVIGYIAMKSLGINFKVISAEWLFFWPFKYIMKYVLHAFPVGKHSGNAITKSLNIFKENDNVNLIICPEGHLSAVDKWNPGFYVIAKKANVPIDLVILNYNLKVITICHCYDITDMSIDDLFDNINLRAKIWGAAKYKDKFRLHKNN